MTGRTAQYLIVIYALEHAEGVPVPTGQVGRVLDRSPAAATEMIQRLADDELVEYERYYGVKLTTYERKQAADLFETHETFCRFFRDVPMLDDYANEALSLAGVVDPEIARRLETTILPPDDATSKSVIFSTLEQSTLTEGDEQTGPSMFGVNEN